MKDLIEIAKKQIMPDYLELMTIQDIVNQYSEQPWSALWAASMCYQAGRIAGIRQERARRNGKALPRVKIAFTDDRDKIVSFNFETGQTTLRVPKGQQVHRRDIEAAMDMAKSCRNRKERG